MLHTSERVSTSTSSSNLKHNGIIIIIILITANQMDDKISLSYG